MNDDTTTRPAAERGSIPAAPTNVVEDERRTDNDAFLPADRMENLRTQWDGVQAAFVDDPRSAVQKAHSLVGSLVDELTKTFARERESLEGQWNSGGNVDTEALRIAMQRYRSFFNRLLGDTP
ncbi:MAG: hypothetical protein ABI182_00845 [Candidatus Baltobacteraceae bacterium]